MTLPTPSSLSFPTLRELRGAPLSVLVAICISPYPVTRSWIEQVTGYSHEPVIIALTYLLEASIVEHVPQGWISTDLAPKYLLHLLHEWTDVLITILERGEPAPPIPDPPVCPVCHSWPCLCALIEGPDESHNPGELDEWHDPHEPGLRFPRW